MIIETMSHQEIANELLKDKEELKERIITKISYNGKSYRRTVLKHHGDNVIYFPSFSVKTSRNNVYHVIPYSYGKREYKRDKIHVLVYTIYYQCGKLEAIWLSLDKSELTFLTNHSLCRYRDRVIQKHEISLRDTLEILVRRNSFMVYSPAESIKYNNQSLVTTHECSFVSEEESEDILVIITCLAFDMLKTSQIDIKQNHEFGLRKLIELDIAC